MMYSIYNSEGRIVRILACNNIQEQLNTGEGYLNGVYDDTKYYIENDKPVLIPEQPAGYYVFDYKKNWRFYDMDRPDIVDYIASLTDCHVFCDEGQDLFDSYEGTKMSLAKRKSLTRTRHLRKTLVLVSQRAQAIAVTARANVNVFQKTVKILSWPKPYFQIWATEDVDAQNFPI